jgi:Domain of unknown function (DUF4147)
MATRDRLLALNETAVAAAHPSACLPAHLPAVPDAGRLIVIGAGKAATAAMAVVAEEHYRRLGALAAIGGFATAPYGTRSAANRPRPAPPSIRRRSPGYATSTPRISCTTTTPPASSRPREG